MKVSVLESAQQQKFINAITVLIKEIDIAAVFVSRVLKWFFDLMRSVSFVWPLD